MTHDSELSRTSNQEQPVARAVKAHARGTGSHGGHQGVLNGQVDDENKKKNVS